MAASKWARLQTDVACELRRGAWYRVLQLRPFEAILDVIGRRHAVPRRFLEFAARPMAEWSVVEFVPGAARTPASWGTAYGVCPACRHRVPLSSRLPAMRCSRCNGMFPVGWEHPFRLKARETERPGTRAARFASRLMPERRSVPERIAAAAG